jgi:hypothetical protein
MEELSRIHQFYIHPDTSELHRGHPSSYSYFVDGVCIIDHDAWKHNVFGSEAFVELTHFPYRATYPPSDPEHLTQAHEYLIESGFSPIFAEAILTAFAGNLAMAFEFQIHPQYEGANVDNGQIIRPETLRSIPPRK